MLESFPQPRSSLALLVALAWAGNAAAVELADFDGAAARIHGDANAAHVKILASDAFDGRAPGTAGERKTLDYLQAQFREASLEPAYANGVLQSVPLTEATIGADAAADDTAIGCGHRHSGSAELKRSASDGDRAAVSSSGEHGGGLARKIGRSGESPCFPFYSNDDKFLKINAPSLAKRVEGP